MSNFFSKTINDIRFVLNGEPANTRKTQRRRKRGIFAMVGLGLIFIQLIFMLMFIFKMVHLDILPMKYFAMLTIVLVLILLYNFMSQFTKAHIFGKILSVFMSGILLFGFIVGNQLSDTFSSITEPTIQTDVITFLVLSEDKADSIEDVYSYTIGYNSDIEGTVITNAFANIENENNIKLKSKPYTDWEHLVNALYENKDIKAIAVTEGMRISLNEQFEDFSTRTKSVGTVKIETKVNVEIDTPKKDVDSEAFIVYVSGSDTYGSVSDTGRSDVNILAVINPKTRQVLLISTPRDYYINITSPSGKTGLDKLTHAGNYGTSYSIKVLENLYGVDIDYYLKLNFTGCINIIDALGGITINSEYAFTNGLDAAPIRYNFVKGPNQCDGAKALAFIRERQTFKNGDLQRGRNQQAAISGIIDKATSPAILTNYAKVLDAVSSMMITNMPTSNITSLIKAQLDDMRSWNVQSYSLGTAGIAYRDGQLFGLKNMSVVLPDYNSVNVAIELMNKIYYGEVFNVDEYVSTLPNVKPTTSGGVISTPTTKPTTAPTQAETKPVETEKPTETQSSTAASQTSTENASSTAKPTEATKPTTAQPTTQAPTKPQATTEAATQKPTTAATQSSQPTSKAAGNNNASGTQR